MLATATTQTASAAEVVQTAEAPWRVHLRSHPAASDWRSAIGNELARLEVLTCQRNGCPHLCGVDTALDEAQRAIMQRRRRWERVKAWWSGWDAERAWRAVHAAEVALVSRSNDLCGRLASVREEVAKELPATDSRLQALMRLEPAAITEADQHTAGARIEHDTPLPAARAIVSEAMQAAFMVADDALRRVRILRNQMLIFGSVLVLINLVIGVVGSLGPGAVPMCVPDTICPTGRSSASGGDVWQVQLFGVLGSVVAVVVLLINRQPKLITYTLTSYQSLVKIALGASLAVVGVLALAVNAVSFVPDNTAGLLLTALVFGYAQQIATRFLDKTAGNLVTKAKTGTAHQE